MNTKNTDEYIEQLRYGEQLQRADGDAKAALVALAAVIVVWLLAGFGVARLDLVVLHTPLWVFTGLLLPWLAAIAAAIVLGRRFVAEHDDKPTGKASASGPASADALAQDAFDLEQAEKPEQAEDSFAADDVPASPQKEASLPAADAPFVEASLLAAEEVRHD